MFTCEIWESQRSDESFTNAGYKAWREKTFAEITAFLTANNAEDKLFFAANSPIITAGGAEIVYP